MAWKEMDDINASVREMMRCVSAKKNDVDFPSGIRSHADAIAEDVRMCKAEIGRIEAEAALHQKGGIFRELQKSDNMPKDTVFMGEIRAAMQLKENSLQIERGKTVSLRERIRQDGKALAERIEGKHDELAVRFQKKGR